MNLTRESTAAHEIAHILCAALTMRRHAPDLYRGFIGEVSVTENGGHAAVFPNERLAALGTEVPREVRRMMASGPIVLRGADVLRGIIRDKQVPLSGVGMSGPDVRSMLANGGHHLTITCCETLSALAKLVHSQHFIAVVDALADAGELVLPLAEWLSPQAADKALRNAGADYMKLVGTVGAPPAWSHRRIDQRLVA